MEDEDNNSNIKSKKFTFGTNNNKKKNNNARKNNNTSSSRSVSRDNKFKA